jgi:hypothetical protein
MKIPTLNDTSSDIQYLKINLIGKTYSLINLNSTNRLMKLKYNQVVLQKLQNH